ncbi:DUF3124 domain-containing protein [uncultured Winogradskyella sp.]|uniref:DUF3124 domain-containing protein n=1 Tax=uncultured Winogradskyella sp. TaxID=395353 RepID=UPI00260262B4|nr:DUF3124 domain-containing protein [uncultured Winogradskyella sp.]
MKKLDKIFISIIVILALACKNPNPNLDTLGQDELEALEVDKTPDESSLSYNNEFYVPIYSDIYIDSQNPKHLLSATLSIRNTNSKDSLFVSKINYYDTHGLLVKKFIDKPISLPPMATVNYVIEKEDDTGGSGANFIVHVSSRSPMIRPLIQAIMIGQYSNKSFSFSTDGYPLE